jgi:hypothetical protein
VQSSASSPSRQRWDRFTGEYLNGPIGFIELQPLKFAKTEREPWQAVIVNQQIRSSSDDAAGHALLCGPLDPGLGFVKADGLRKPLGGSSHPPRGELRKADSGLG